VCRWSLTCAFMSLAFVAAPWAFQSSLVTVNSGKSEGMHAECCSTAWNLPTPPRSCCISMTTPLAVWDASRELLGRMPAQVCSGGCCFRRRLLQPAQWRSNSEDLHSPLLS
jgi:hypothetical protein